MSTGTSKPTLDLPEDETLEKIDFVIQGLENGQFKELAKKVDFHQKLKGEDSKRFIKSLIDVINAQELQLQLARQDLLDLEARLRYFEDMKQQLMDMQNLVQKYNQDMRGIANALLQIHYPDPLGQNYNLSIDDIAAENFVNDYKQKY